MINYEFNSKKNIEELNLSWPQILDHSNRILMIRGSGSGKTNALLYLINQQNDDDCNIIDKFYLHVKDPNEKNINILLKT